MSAPQFVIDSNPTTQWPVTVKIPKDGAFSTYQFLATFRLLAEDGWVALFERDTSKDQEGEAIRNVLAHNAQVLPGVVIAWDVKDAQGCPIGIDALPQMLAGPYARPLSAGLVRAISEIRYGVHISDTPSASEKNSEPSPDAGPNSALKAAGATNSQTI